MSSSTAQREGYERACPVCGGSGAHLIFRQSFAHLSEVGLLDGYDVVVCGTCGMAFANNIPPQPVLDAYYRDLSKYEYQHHGGKESETDEWRLRHTATVIEGFLPNRETRILEIGCATGRLLSFLKIAGFPNVFGLDPSPGCAQAAAKLYGVPVCAKSVHDVAAPEQPYDFIILLCVLEHIRDLQATLRKLHDLLSPHGRVYVEVPDAVHPLSRPDAPFQDFSTEHINFFSASSLTNLMEAGGFRKVECGYAAREYEAGTTAPVVYGVFEKAEACQTTFVRDRETEPSLLAYIRECEQMDSRLRRKIQTATANRKVIVWGVGTHTRRLLAAGALATNHIVAFVDSNPNYQGHALNGVPVVAPEALRKRGEAILISSYLFEREIERQIREQLQLPNELILLYKDL